MTKNPTKHNAIWMKLIFFMALFFTPSWLFAQLLDVSGVYNNVVGLDSLSQLNKVTFSKIINQIDFDGYVSEGEWNDVNTLPLISHWPTFSNKPNGRTLFRVAYDDKFIYLSALCYDTLPHIQSPTFERDIWNMSMDQIAIVLDTYNDNENGLIFIVTPTGSRIDVSIRNDAQGSAPVDLSWNSFWEARVSMHDNGWAVEARIPLTSLRFQPINGNVTMGLIAYRYIARERQMDIFPNVPPKWGFWSFIKPSQAQDISFTKDDNQRPWFTSPYLLAAAGYHHKPASSTYPEKVSDNRVTAGLDVQHAITDNLNMDLTLNTDFAQVEVDDQVVNLSRFSLFFPEKRRFFLERSSIMDFSFENNNRLFYSRRIGINNERIIPLFGGARIVGRLQNYDVGVMTMESQGKDDLPSENFGVFRLRRKVSKNNSYIGGILTTRTDWHGANNIAYGLDGIINLFGNDYLKINMAASHSFLDTISYNDFLSDRTRAYVMWENRSQIGFNYSFSYSQVDKNYLPGLGFEARNNFKAVGDRVSYGWFSSKSKSVRYIRFDINAASYFSNTSNHLESLLTAPGLYVEWKKNSNISLTLNRFHDNVPRSFNISSDIAIGPSKYINKDVTLVCQTPPVNFVNATLNATIGSFYGGDRISVGATPTYVISKYLTLSGFYQFNRILFSNAQIYKAQIGRLKLSTSFNVKLSVNVFVQVNSLTNACAINLRLRYNSKDGNDFYFVYNEVLNNQSKSDVYSPFSDYRAFILKYIYTFHLTR